MREDLLNDLGLLDEGDDPHGSATAGTHEGVHLVDLLDQTSPGALRCGGGHDWRILPQRQNREGTTSALNGSTVSGLPS